MSIIITETIERSCCDMSKDLMPYNGAPIGGMIIHAFCRHCGQPFYKRYRTDAAGDTDYEYEKL